jgi:hypothetical protein
VRVRDEEGVTQRRRTRDMQRILVVAALFVAATAARADVSAPPPPSLDERCYTALDEVRRMFQPGYPIWTLEIGADFVEGRFRRETGMVVAADCWFFLQRDPDPAFGWSMEKKRDKRDTVWHRRASGWFAGIITYENGGSCGDFDRVLRGALDVCFSRAARGAPSRP